MTDRLDKNKQISLTKKETIARHKNMSCKTYTVKIQKNKLNDNQIESLNLIFLEQKWYKNFILNWNQLDPENHKISKFDIKINDITHKDKDMNDVLVKIQKLSVSERQCLISRMLANIKTLSSLKKKGYQRPGRLRFSKEETAIDLKQYGVTHKILSSKRIKVQGISGSLPVNGLDQFIYTKDVEMANARLLHIADDFYVQFTTYVPKEEVISNGELIGIDFGCSTSFTLSTGEKIDIKIPESESLKKAQRNLAKKTKGSKNYYKAEIKLRKQYQKQNNIKDDLANKLISRLSKCELIVIQDEQLSNWQKTGHGKAVQHSILGRVKAKLKELDNVEVLSKWDATSQLCPICGTLTKHPVNKRTFHCSNCGYEDDRDVNAAKNMLLFYDLKYRSTSGSEEINACGDDGSTSEMNNFSKQPSSMKQEAFTL